MFPPPWTTRYEVEEGPGTLQDLEKRQHLQGRCSSNQPSWLPKRKSDRPKIFREQNSFALSASTVGGRSIEERSMTNAHMNQMARDICLSIPKHPPKFSAAMHGGCRLFGEAALLPLQSQARARARSEATTSARAVRCKSRNRSVGWQRATSRVFDGVRRTAWGEDLSVEIIRHAINARRAQEEPEPEPEPEPEDDLSQERPVSEDSISTHELVYGNEFRSTSRGDEGCRMTRPSGYGERRKEFFYQFRDVAEKKNSHPRENVTTVEEEFRRALARKPSSDSSGTSRLGEATAKFLRHLSDHGRAPWPSILKWNENTRAVEVGGMGLGDEIMNSLATVLPILRNVERLIACDNRMTDPGTHAVVKAVQGMTTLTHLDLSENEVGTLAARELREYMRSKRCHLRSLAIRKADIDDGECREFMAALGSNKSLLEVDLTSNLIGKQETVKVTGAESVGIMLKTNNTLTSLNLGWNSLRMDSAVHVALSLRHNSSLQTLGLAYNSFSDHASQMLATSLFENQTLTCLDLSFNSITPSAAMVFAFALKVNRSIKFIQLEGNPIGQNGGEALVTAMRVSDGNLHVGMNNCDTSSRDKTLFNAADATGEYDLDLQLPYNRVVAQMLLKLANRKPTCHFRSLKHILGKKIVNVKLHRGNSAVAPADPRVDVTRRIKQLSTKKGILKKGLFMEYAQVLGMKPEDTVATSLMQIWSEVLTTEPKGDRSSEGGDSTSSAFFESLFIFADKDDKGELVVEDLETLFQALHLPYGEARMRHIMSKYDADRSGSVDLEEFIHYMSAAHLKQPFIQHGLLCTEDGKEWQVPLAGTLRVKFVQEPSADRTLGEMSTDGGVECLIKNIRQSPTDDTRKRLFELATCNSGTYFTSYQAQGLLEAVSSNYRVVDAVATLLPQLASSYECASFVDSNLDHRLKFMLRFTIGASWGPMMGLPSGHYSLDMQSARDRLAAFKIAAVANHERQCSKFNGHANTSQHGNWQNFRNAEYNREPVVLTSAWFINPPPSGILRFDYASTSTPDRHQCKVSARRFQRMMERLGVSTLISSATPIDEKVISSEALVDLATSHWRKVSSSSPIYKIDQRDYYRSGSSPDDVSLASWWSAVEVTSIDIERKDSFAHLMPSETYIKAFYKLRELEVALVSACLTTDQLARIVESFPREGQIRAEVILTFYHKVTDIDHMCLLVDALRPDEGREVLFRRGHLNCINPVFVDRYYRLDLSVWDEREMAKILIRLAMTEPGENWLEETFQRNSHSPLIPGWELPLDWTKPEVSAEKKDGGPPTQGLLTLWYSSSPRRGCAPNLLVRQGLEARTLCRRVGTTFSSTQDVDILAFTLEWQQRFCGFLDKGRRGQLLLTDEIALGFEMATKPSSHEEDTCRDESTYNSRDLLAPSSITELSDEGTLMA